jgi:outer membrane protein assembly factor BamB
VGNTREMEAYMHNVEHESSQNDSAVKMTERPAGEELQARPSPGGMTMTKKLRLPRNWHYVLAGGTVFLVLVVILASVLSSRSQPLHQPSHSRPVPVPTAMSRSIPTPAATPINAPVWSDHNVNLTIADGVAYAGTSDDAVYALHTSDGSLLWHTGIDGSVEELPVVANGVIYVDSFVGLNGPAHLYALRASDGTVLWHYSSNSYISRPTLDSGVVYIASQGDGVTALRASGGARLWHFPGSAYQTPSVVNGVLYVNASVDGQSGIVYALRASDGTVLWRYSTSGSVDTLTVQNREVYVFSQNKLSALRASDGHQLWNRPMDATFYQSPQLFAGVIYFMATKISLETPTARSTGLLPQTMAVGSLLWSNGQAIAVKETTPLKEGKSSVYAIRASDGTVLWQHPMNNGGDSFADWLQVEHGVVYTSMVVANSSNTGIISALQSSNGAVIWQDMINGSPSGVLLVGGVIYASAGAASSSAVYALRARDGALLWSYPIDGSVFNEPLLVGTTVYTAAGNGMVYALRAVNGTLVWHYLTKVGN